MTCGVFFKITQEKEREIGVGIEEERREGGWRKLEEKNWLTDSKEKGSIEIYNSTNDNKIIDFCYNLINA